MKPLTKENILELVNEYDIWKYYCTPFKKIGIGFCSELRKDKVPTCYIYKSKNRLVYKDFAGDHLDCFGYLQKKFHCGFFDTLGIINNDFKLNLGGFKPLSPTIGYSPILYNKALSESNKRPTEIKVQIRKWDLRDKEYWFDKYRFTCKDLIFFKIYPLNYFWVNDRIFKADQYSYGFFGDYHIDGREKWKIYQPLNKDLKWFSNNNKGDFLGIDQLPWFGERLIITKGMKDIIALYKLGYCAIAPHGESHQFDSDFIAKLYEKFKRIDMLYDNDTTGLKFSKSRSELFNFGNIILPKFNGKDISDYIEKYGYTQGAEFLASYYS